MKEPTLTTGSRAILHIAPGRLSRYQGQECDVTGLAQNGAVAYLDIQFCDGSVSLVPESYLRPVEAPQKARRSPLRLKPDVDNRTEAERMDEGLQFLEKRGYIVLRVGQGRAAAICHACTRANKRLTQIRCKDCGSRGFAPSTNSTEGTPDSFIRHPQWGGDAHWLAMEWKDGPNGRRKPAQKALEVAGHIVVAWNLASCLSAVAEFERDVIGREPHQDISAYLKRYGGMPESEDVK